MTSFFNPQQKIWSLDRFIPLMLEAGRMAVDAMNKAKVEQKQDGSLVTEADIAIEDFFCKELENEDQGIFLIGEESVEKKSQSYLQRAFKEHAFILDPIDGTVNYANGLELWGVSLGYAKEGELQEGAIYLPLLNKLYITDGAEVLEIGTKDHEVLSSKSILSIGALPFERGLVGLTQVFVKGQGLKMPCCSQCLSSAVVALTYLLRGSYQAYVGDLKLWDVAGALPMLAKAGLEMGFLNGDTLNCKLDPAFLALEENAPVRFKYRSTMLFSRVGVGARLRELNKTEK